MKKKLAKILSAGIVAVMLATSLAACGGSAASEEAAPAAEAEEESTEESGEAAPADASGLKCAFICSDIGTVNGQKWLAGSKEAAEAAGAEFHEFDCKMDVTQQLQYMDECMTQGYNCVLIHPVDSSALADKVDEMEAAGINVGTINIRIDTDYTAHIGMPNYEAGIPLANAIGELTGGTGKVVYIQGPVEVMQLVESDDAIMDTFEADYPGLEIIDVANGDFSVEAGDQLTRDFITKYGADGFDVIIAMNDSMALGASQALSASGIDPSTKIITGGDGTDDALQAIADGRITLTQLQLSKEWAAEAMNDLIEANAAGKHGEHLYDVEHDMVMVTKDNVAEYLGGDAPAAEEEAEAPAEEETAEAGEETFIGPEFDAADYEGIKCAFVCSDTGTVNGQKWLAGCQEAAEDLGLEFQVFDCKMDVTTQLQYLDECMTQGFGCVMVHPVDSSALVDKIDEMEAAGINVGTINIRIDTNYSAHVGMPNYEAGIPLARKIGELAGGEGKVVYIQGPVEVMQLVESDDAVLDTFAAEFPGMEIIDTVNGDFSVEAGDQLTRDFITKYGPDGFDVIIAMNDSMALGASQALAASGVDPSTKVITGGDGTDDALEAIKDGRITLTQLQLSKEWAKEGMNMLLNQHVKGETGASRGEREEAIHNTVMVTDENVDEYLN